MVRKTVTVLFADVTGSTALGERLDPEALRRVMTQYYDAARATLERHGGTVEKFIGDAVMAVFGVPVTHEDDALRAARAAVELRDADLGVTLRIGVNTGEVVADEGETLVTGDDLSNMWQVSAGVAGAAPVSVGFGVRRANGKWVRLAVDDSPPYRAFLDPAKYRRNEKLALVAVVRGLDGTTATSKVVSFKVRGR